VVAVSNPDLKLKPGMTANVKILVAKHENVLLVPNAAFRVRVDGSTATPASAQGGGAQAPRGPQAGGDRSASRPGAGAGRPAEPGARGAVDGGQQRVWILQDGRPQERMIRTGLSDGQRTEVLDGLRDGEVVIVGLGTNSRGSTPAGGPRLRL
jgi:HlyD family secretion protein